AFDELHMVQQAAKVGRELGVSREDQDAWALRSHERAAAAQDAGRFDDEIVPVGEVTADESIRRDTTLDKLASLKPAMDPEGTVTAGNAPGVNDGASCVVVCSEEFAQRRGLEALATIVSQGYVADEFAWLARTPANAGEQALEKAGKSIGDVERVEVNEAFCSVAVNSLAMLGPDPETANANGCSGVSPRFASSCSRSSRRSPARSSPSSRRDGAAWSSSRSACSAWRRPQGSLRTSYATTSCAVVPLTASTTSSPPSSPAVRSSA